MNMLKVATQLSVLKHYNKNLIAEREAKSKKMAEMTKDLAEKDEQLLDTLQKLQDSRLQNHQTKKIVKM